MPWLNIPRHRETVFVPPPRLPGGLLGGSDGPKLSKLQALAAARKKKAETAKKSDDQEERTQKRMSRLSISDAQEDKPKSGSIFLAKRQKLAAESPSAAPTATIQTLPEESTMHLDTPVAADTCQDVKSGEKEDNDEPIPRLQPSSFADVLCGLSASSAAGRAPPSMALPYTASALFNPAAFDGPSPDDVVFAAQAKGSRMSKN